MLSSVKLTPTLIENFAGVYLSPMYDNPQPTPDFHRQCWELYCSDDLLAAVAAPREHAKSTALTHDFILAAVCFRWESHVALLSATEEMAMMQLGDISKELHDNEELRADFGIKNFVVDSKGELIVECDDNHQFRIFARGADQRIRGMKWRGRRPGLIVVDDGEEDEQVESIDRRKKFKKWVLRALIPMGRRGCRVRIHGTILHVDSLLANLMKDSEWKSLRFRAHRSFDDFSDILWPDQFPASRLRSIRQRFINQMDSSGYAQEYLNDPQDNEDQYLRREWFLPMDGDDFDNPKIFGVGVDFAVSTADSANRTSFTIGGKDSANFLHFVDERVGRWDAEEIIDQFFLIHTAYHPDFWWVEDGQIWKTLWPTIRKEMLRRGVFLNFLPRTPIKDKATRARPWQKRMKALSCKFDKSSSWYPAYEEECLRFTPESEATLDDQFDSSALLALGFEDISDIEPEDFETEEEEEFRRRDPRVTSGRSKVTGY